MENINFDLSTMFGEVQNQLERQFKSSAVLRDHAKTIIGVSSVVVSFFATFKIFGDTTIKSNTFLIIVFLFIALIYGILMVLAIRAASPFALNAPIKPDLKNYIEAYADKDEKTIVANQINLYLRAIQENEPIIKHQAILSNIVDYLLCAVVVLVILATILSVTL
jgi:hypothetical protein